MGNAAAREHYRHVPVIHPMRNLCWIWCSWLVGSGGDWRDWPVNIAGQRRASRHNSNQFVQFFITRFAKDASDAACAVHNGTGSFSHLFFRVARTLGKRSIELVTAVQDCYKPLALRQWPIRFGNGPVFPSHWFCTATAAGELDRRTPLATWCPSVCPSVCPRVPAARPQRSSEAGRAAGEGGMLDQGQYMEGWCNERRPQIVSSSQSSWF